MASGPSRVEIRYNHGMASTYVAVGEGGNDPLPADLEEVRHAGVVALADRIYLAAYVGLRLPPAQLTDAWSSERWVNDVQLESTLPPSNPAWRPHLVGWALTIGGSLLPQAATLFDDGRAVQACISLQSAEGRADPDTDFASGAFCLYSVCTPDNDLSLKPESFNQPCLTLTVDEGMSGN